jgi:hypothetical protein
VKDERPNVCNGERSGAERIEHRDEFHVGEVVAVVSVVSLKHQKDIIGLVLGTASQLFSQFLNGQTR